MIDPDYVKQTAHALTQSAGPNAEDLSHSRVVGVWFPQPVWLRLCDMNTDPPEPSDECLKDWACAPIADETLAKLLYAATTGGAHSIQETFTVPEDGRTMTIYGVRLEFPDGRMVARRFPKTKALAPGYGLTIDWEITCGPLELMSQ